MAVHSAPYVAGLCRTQQCGGVQALRVGSAATNVEVHTSDLTADHQVHPPASAVVQARCAHSPPLANLDIEGITGGMAVHPLPFVAGVTGARHQGGIKTLCVGIAATNVDVPIPDLIAAHVTRAA